ncbi:hypothetical protein A3I95_00335 [Candidatus Nomurabacteria bacterium RIFCSPLOWO2_02_FULL_44_12]|uniref:Ada DNA repair metal-binding domain-containing protein n=1 Tax=Candidatus Nomurabacteria bacterium RIFCSPLOWO2_12_FULL_44_11 TaxID=1801796 RepID=A0A1F6Y5T7_9BACT|nr:MAG: hypothetical protein A3G53_00230 [Candidatus Nomurabacteria bacterium RIFCSPLOWO2_12_FULL_44_11]OGJ07880.1 MAG: hypothetical protein A3I95_00335 [Candidatus Nomurabacteria bacterium RIFCSPLOWO2_02_FULL_44_12]
MQKIKPKITNWIESETGKDILVILIVILVGLGSFELGRLSKGVNSGGLKVEYPEGEQAQNQAASGISAFEYAKTQVVPNNAQKAFFASSRGSKYYPVGCAGGKSIKQENRVYFSTKTDAERAGYELSSSC